MKDYYFATALWPSRVYTRSVKLWNDSNSAKPGFFYDQLDVSLRVDVGVGVKGTILAKTKKKQNIGLFYSIESSDRKPNFIFNTYSPTALLRLQQMALPPYAAAWSER